MLKLGQPIAPLSATPGVDRRPPRSQPRLSPRHGPQTWPGDTWGPDARGAHHPGRGLRGAAVTAGHGCPSWADTGSRTLASPSSRVWPMGCKQKQWGALAGRCPCAGQPSPGQWPEARGPGPPAGEHRPGPVKENQTQGVRESRGPRRAGHSGQRHVLRGECFLSFNFSLVRSTCSIMLAS